VENHLLPISLIEGLSPHSGADSPNGITKTHKVKKFSPAPIRISSFLREFLHAITLRMGLIAYHSFPGRGDAIALGCAQVGQGIYRSG
jgi:hypothetical protein